MKHKKKCPCCVFRKIQDTAHGELGEDCYTEFELHMLMIVELIAAVVGNRSKNEMPKQVDPGWIPIMIDDAPYEIFVDSKSVLDADGKVSSVAVSLRHKIVPDDEAVEIPISTIDMPMPLTPKA